jgi:hypothetical protein
VVQDNNRALGERQRREGAGDRVHGQVTVGSAAAPVTGSTASSRRPARSAPRPRVTLLSARRVTI